MQGDGAGQFYFPNGVAVDGSGDVFVTDYNDNRLDEFTSAGSLVQTWGTAGGGAGQLNEPYGVAVDGAGDVFVANNSTTGSTSSAHVAGAVRRDR